MIVQWKVDPLEANTEGPNQDKAQLYLEYSQYMGTNSLRDKMMLTTILLGLAAKERLHPNLSEDFSTPV